MVELHGGVDVFVPLVEIGGKTFVALRINCHPVEHVGELRRETRLGHRRRGITGLMLERAVSVNAGVAATERVANLNVGGKIAALRRTGAVAHLDAAGDSLHGNFVVRPIATGVAGFVVQHLDAAVLERREVTIALEHARSHDAVGERERGGVFLHGYVVSGASGEGES